MRARLSRLIDFFIPGKHRTMTLVITALAAVFMVSGVGSKIMNAHDSFAKTDRLAAISLILSGVSGDALPVTLLDVNDATRQAWKSPGATPHAALAELIRIASSNGAKGILLDFDLTAEVPGAAGDPALLALLEGYPATAPLLMLVRKIGFAKAVSEGGDAGLLAASATASPYDAAAAGKPNIVWVTTLNDIDSDRTVRRIRLWQTVCDGASGVGYPSAALVTAARLIDGKNHEADLEAFLAARVAEDCGKRVQDAPDWPPMRQQSAQLPYVFGDDASSPALLRIESAGKKTVVLRRIGADRLVSHADGKAAIAGEVDRDPFEGRVAIIGASYTESSDVHETPLGTMPGSIILANSIVQAEKLAETVPASAFVRNLLALEVFLIFAVIVRYFVGVAALIGIGVISVVSLIIISRLFGFESGFSTVGVAITGFALFKLIDALGHIALDIPKRGWRAFMKA
jgi:CHASE2 domain-containing sensor protein